MTTEKQTLPEAAVFGALWKNKGLILAIAILAGGAGYYVADRATPMYQAETSLLFRFDREYSPRNLASDRWYGEPIRVNLDGALHNELEILGSRRLLEESLAQVGPAPALSDAVVLAEPISREQQLKQLRDALSIRRVDGTSVARLTFTHADPGYATAFLSTLVETHINTRRPLLDWSPTEPIREVVDWAEAQMFEAQRALAAFRVESGILDADIVRTTLLERRTGLRLDLMRLGPDAPAAAREDVTAGISLIEAELTTLAEHALRLDALSSAAGSAAEQFRTARDIFAERELSERLASALGPSIILLDQPATRSDPVGLSAVVTAMLSGVLGLGLACLLALWLSRTSYGIAARRSDTPARSAPATITPARRNIAPNQITQSNRAKSSR